MYRPLGPPIGGVQAGGPGGGGPGYGGPGGPRGPPPPGAMGMGRGGYPPNQQRGNYPQQHGNYGGHPQGAYDYRGGNHQGGNGHTTVVVQPSQPQVLYGGGGGYGSGGGFGGGSLAMGMRFFFSKKSN